MVENTISYNHIPVKQSTFKGGLGASIHRWFRLTPSFGPELVVEMMSKLGCQASDIVLDPFSGASTTLIESALNGVSSYGFEINPLLHWVGKVCIDWTPDTDALRRDLEAILQNYTNEVSKISFDDLENHGLEIPSIHNPLRWWRKDVLRDLLVLKRSIRQQCRAEQNAEFFMLAFAGVLVPELTNVTLGKLQLHFIEREDDLIDVKGTFQRHANTMIGDLEVAQKITTPGKAKIFHTNSVTLEGVEIDKPINCVITSPPYPNRYSYVWNTRPHLYMLDFFSNAKQASDLDKKTIGGTWGTATSMLAKGRVDPDFEFFEESVTPVIEAIREQDNLMANYVMKYFNLLALQIKAMEGLPQNGLRCAYVVGNSRVKGVYVETDVLLAKIFMGLGYSIDSIERIRKRNSGKDLHESIVYSWKP
ncbi:class I SAM-dependent methyltransferase [Burkholderia cepacia]|uniref:site-specific DNA-methyltransferase (cytosine-N(4)-specific) n=1 Tax=Burkholderia cepacia TaxID=292 RepID=A0AAQ0F7Z0_BURCE|nr:hypothetical protein [Burkholderia cepacia]QFS35131.1 DNA methyla [Burkholderia cepacia]RAQ03575.1 hypothetical protein DPR02_29470 [Burkholderia cepacia]